MANTNCFLDYAGLELFWSKVKGIIENNELVTANAITNLDTRIDNLESTKSDIGHTHDDRYYTESEINDLLNTKSNTNHTHTFASLTSKPTTISGYGITDALTTSNYTSYTVKKDGTGASGTWGINITGNAATATNAGYATSAGSAPASDVYSWAKQSTKPSYSFSEITSKPTTLAGYGITDAASKDHTHTDKLNKIIETSYSNLVTLRNSSSLVPGQQYRITDYTCTTTQENTRSAEHVFDIIVTADNTNVLNEVARAAKHEGDSYFANNDLNAWKIWYCIDNDTNRFKWADATNGKGVIYRMIDEFNNDVPYDFKNIMFKDPNSPGNNFYYYTFSGDGGEETDYTIFRTTNIFSNTILPFYGSDLTNSKQTINKILFSVGGDGNCYGNYFGSGCYNITLAYYCRNNTFGNGCYSNSLSPHCSNNTFGDDCHSNVLNSGCTYNIFEYNCYSNTLGEYCSNNTFGNNCYSNSFENYCEYTIFGNECYSNRIGSDCYYNIFGNDCHENVTDFSCSDNTFGNTCYSNTLDGDCVGNNFGNNCFNNSLGSECMGNSLGIYCDHIAIGGMSSDNSFSNDCSYIRFASDSSASATKYDLYQHNHFGVGCQYILFKETEPDDGNLYNIQNYEFAQGLQGTSSSYLTVNGVRNRSYETKVAKNSNGELKIYCEADLIQ